MKVVIDIPDYNLNEVQNGSIACGMILKAVKNGSILPTEHGDLIDRNLLRTKVWSDSERRKDSLFGDGERLCITMIDEATPVIPANNHSESYNEWLTMFTVRGED